MWQSTAIAKQVKSRYLRGVSTAHRVHAPGRVNLIGEHTDYTGGLVFPMAIDRGTTITYVDNGNSIALTSSDVAGELSIDLPFSGPSTAVEPHWGAYVAAMAREVGASSGIRGHIVSDIPAGAGLSSSAALECAVGLALGFEGTPLELSQAAQRAEHEATGVPTGIMDQLSIAAGIEGHATMIDCHTYEVTPCVIPSGLDIVVRFIVHRTLEGSAYADRVAECALAEAEIGPLRLATRSDVESIADDLIRRRARHVTTENQRVRDFAVALGASDFLEAGRIMQEGHASLRDDFETSTPVMDAAVAELDSLPGVHGSRMTGGGFGGCIVALAEPGAITDGWLVSPSAGARLLS